MHSTRGLCADWLVGDDRLSYIEIWPSSIAFLTPNWWESSVAEFDTPQSALGIIPGAGPRNIDCVETPIDRGEVLRYLGYPVGYTPKETLQKTLDDWIDKANAIATPRATYILLPVVEIDRSWIRLQGREGITEFAGAIGEFLGPSQYIAAFIATAGPAVEHFASDLMSQGDDLAAMVVNAVGAERAEAAEGAVIEELRKQMVSAGFVPTLPYSPGYCGMALTEQAKLFSLFGGEGAGVTLTGDCLMRPLKSISGLIGLGRAENIEAHGSPCDRCKLYNCAMRR